jgi:hypothetical protein
VSYCTHQPNGTQAPRSNSSQNFNAHTQSDASQHRSGHHPLPFSALPHQLRRDLKGNQTAISLAAALLEYARTKPYCYPTTARLAEDLGVCQNTVRAALLVGIHQLIGTMYINKVVLLHSTNQLGMIWPVIFSMTRNICRATIGKK